MSSGGSEKNEVEDTTAKDASPDASKPYMPISPGDTTSESHHEEPNIFGPTVPIDITEDVGIGIDVKEREILSEVRSSLQRIGSGVEELATTVQDLLGLSDSDDDSDYVPGPGGRREFSWGRLKSHAKRRRQRRHDLRNARGDSQSTSTDDDQESDRERSKFSRDIIPETRECNLEQFRSRAAGDGHKLYCVDFLVADDSLDEDIQRFEETVTEIESGKIEFWKPGHTSSRTDASLSEATGEKWIRQIRINSRAVMEMLRHVFPQLKGYRGQSTIFRRPFQLLVSLHEELREQLTNIQALASDGPGNETNPEDSNSSVKLGMTRTPDWEDPIQELCQNKDALNELICYMDFMESQIMPDSRRYKDESSPLPETIRWEDLWYLFKPGDLIYVKRDTESFDSFTSSEFAQQILRVMHTSLTDTSPNLGPIGVSGVSEQFSVFGHFIDFNGGTYFAMYHIFRPILPFRGQMKVTDLPIYPVSYLEDDQILAQAVSDGETYVSLIERRSGFYSGWTQTISPLGNPLGQRMAEQTRLASPQHIESDILVDFEETFNAFPDWRPRTYVMKIGPFDVDVCKLEPSGLPVLEWDEMGQTRHDDSDQILHTDYTEWREAKKFMAEDPMWDFKLARNRPAPTGKHLALLPRRFFAYAVLERKFVPLNTRSVRSADAEADDQAFKKLEIDRSYKRLILSLVKSHFDKVEAEKKQNVEIDTQDLIRGKGKGVVILLHGAPGVGKTATAEAVALKWKKPLFPITCGDLGYTADTLERSLNEIFRVAHHWDCILLLDEADVFITQRERNDLKRNALVSSKTQNLCSDLISCIGY